MSAITDAALQVAPSTKARGYWATVGRRILRDKVSMACAFVLILIIMLLNLAARFIAGRRRPAGH